MMKHVKDIDPTLPLLFLIAISLPFFTVLNSFFIILLTLWAIVLIIKEKLWRTSHIDISSMLIFTSIFILYFLAYLRDGIFIHGFILEKKMSLLVLPLSIGICSINLNPSKLINIMIGFCLSTALACLVSFIGHWDLISLSPSIDTASILIIHRPYFGMYALFCVLCLFYSIPYFKQNWKRALAILGIIFFVLFSYLIYAKMAILAFVGTVAISALVWGIMKKKYIALSLFFLVIIGILVLYQPLQQMLGKIIKAEPFQIDKNWIYFLSMNLRFAIWDCTSSVLFDGSNWLWGAGLGHQEQLNACYETKSIWLKYNVDPTFLEGFTYNAHNEFLHTWLDLGIIGPAALIFVSVYSIRKAIQERNIFYFSFLMLFILCCMTESLLSSQKGIVFYSFFNSLFFFPRKAPYYVT